MLAITDCPSQKKTKKALEKFKGKKGIDRVKKLLSK